MTYVLIAIGVLTWILIMLIIWIVRERRKYSELHSMYSNGDGGGLGEHASIQEWERLAQASLAHSRARRKNGAHSGKA